MAQPGLFGGSRPMSSPMAGYDPRQFWAQPPQAPAPATMAPQQAKPPGLFGGAAPAQPQGWKAKLAQFSKSGALGDIGMALLANSQNGGNWGGAIDAYGQLSDRRKDQNKERDLIAKIDSLGIEDPAELAFAKANPSEYIAQRFGDVREQKRYDRGREDQLEDRGALRGFEVEDRDLDYDRQDKRYGVEDDQFDRTFNQGANEFNRELGYKYATLNADREEAAADREADANDETLFKGPQLTSVYNRSMSGVDKLEEQQGQLDHIANEALRFTEMMDGYGAIGPSLGAQIGQQFSGIWDPAKGDMEKITKALAPLVRVAGTGASSDRDVEGFQQSVVNMDKSREGNTNFATGADAIRNRHRDYTRFLYDNIDIRDPESERKAKAAWSAYAEENPIYDSETGRAQSYEEIPSFEAWYASKTDDVTDLLDKYR